MKIIEVEKRDKIRNFQPPVDGDFIQAHFNLEPCREIGKIKDVIKEAILEGKIPNAKSLCSSVIELTGFDSGFE